jgi:microcin C transport system permease protein
MIERLFRNELSRKRWIRFRRNRIGVVATWILLIMMFFSFTAEIWANHDPLILKYQGQTYFPVFKYYPPRLFGRDDIAQMDYSELKLGEADWTIWPLIRWDPFQSNSKVESLPSPPTHDNLLGTDEGGRDVASRLLYGFRYSIAYALAVWFFSSVIGMVTGAVMGYAGGWTDLVGQRVIEVLESMPYLMILMTLVSLFEPNLFLLALLTVVFGWVSVSIYFRAEFLKLRRREFVEAARSLGASRSRVIFRHILPNSLTPWITLSPFWIAGYIFQLAALDFLGFGVPAPTPSWGELLTEALKNFRIAWWLAIYPSLALFIALIVLNLIGESVRDALDPRKT